MDRNKRDFVECMMPGCQGASVDLRLNALARQGYVFVGDDEHRRIAGDCRNFTQGLVDVADMWTHRQVYAHAVRGGILYHTGQPHYRNPSAVPGRLHSGLGQMVGQAAKAGYSWRSVGQVVKMASGPGRLIPRPNRNGVCSARVSETVYAVVDHCLPCSDLMLFEVVSSEHGRRLLLVDGLPFELSRGQLAA